MPIFLKHRNEQLTEWMDRPDCDKQLLFNTYRQFGPLNRLLSGWKDIFYIYLKPVIQDIDGTTTVLDIGCGGGDVIRFLNQLCKEENLDVQFTGIDPDSRAHEYSKKMDWDDNIQLLSARTDTLIQNGESYDIVISNHLMHHLSIDELVNISRDAEKLSHRLVIFNDIERSDIGYGLFSISAPLIFRNSFISRDGKLSIRRSFRKSELQSILPEPWKVERKFPFRLLAMVQTSTE